MELKIDLPTSFCKQYLTLRPKQETTKKYFFDFECKGTFCLKLFLGDESV